jgi:hypothetical protein
MNLIMDGFQHKKFNQPSLSTLNWKGSWLSLYTCAAAGQLVAARTQLACLFLLFVLSQC